ncbi:MAG: glycogen synthase GlgA [Desulfomonile tiedjei]|nr:glycogen synthase GlgA [Desulfomonile tiedjei]
MRVLMITPEATPFAQTGGLGEVLSALPSELAELGLEVDVVMPKYRGIDADHYDLEKMDAKIEVTLNAKNLSASLWQHRDQRGARYIFLECDEYYDREYLYGTPDADYEDNSERFVFLARAAIEMALARKIHYDVFHSHDWQAALIPVYLRTLYAWEPLLHESSSVMTIHNLGYQGIFWHLDMPLVGVGWEFFTPRHMEFHGKLNFLKSGIVFADEVNTVSPGYRNEILTPEFGFGLEGVLQEKGNQLSGILNGVDYTIWNPATDSLISANYSPDDLSGKADCKADLQRVAGLPQRPEIPLIGVVSRLSSQKGVDIIEAAIPALMANDLQMVLLGTGDARYQTTFSDISRRYPQNMGVFLAYDYGLAHKIFAGADALLVPSRYEPCGINQLYALKYGTVPIVRATGGLTDTVDQFDLQRDSGTGFRFAEPDPKVLTETILSALKVFVQNPKAWKRLMVRGMTTDLSWSRSAGEYLKLYERAIAGRKTTLGNRPTT